MRVMSLARTHDNPPRILWVKPLPSIDVPGQRLEGEYSSGVSDVLYVGARVGGSHADAVLAPESTKPRIADPVCTASSTVCA
jgi:hypothetical protein